MKQPVETAYTGHGGEPEGEKEAGGGNNGPNMGSDSCSGFTSVSRTRYEDTDEYPLQLSTTVEDGAGPTGTPTRP